MRHAYLKVWVPSKELEVCAVDRRDHGVHHVCACEIGTRSLEVVSVLPGAACGRGPLEHVRLSAAWQESRPIQCCLAQDSRPIQVCSWLWPDWIDGLESARLHTHATAKP
jgi:hypothetical protein